MGNKYADIAFTPTVRELQKRFGSRHSYAKFDALADRNGVLGEREAMFIVARDSFYMASVSETGWPYVQHRGGATGFVRVLDSGRIGFTDFAGNRQYISIGNLSRDERVALIFMDYPNQARLKVFGRASIVEPDDGETIRALTVDGYRARVERGIIINIEAFDWNCRQHITRRVRLESLDQPSERSGART